MAIAEHVTRLHDEAAEVNERRMVVLQGEPAATRAHLETVIDAWGSSPDAWVALGDIGGPWSTLGHDRSNQLLGRTIPGLIIDATASLRPNVIGRSIGSVAGGGLIVLIIGPRTSWIRGPLESDRRLAVVPHGVNEVTNRFRTRFYRTLEQHPGVSVIDADSGEILVDGTTGARPPPPTCSVDLEDSDRIDPTLLAACRTADQRLCVGALSQLTDASVVVLEAHRGRGKSAALGIAAAGHAAAGSTVAVTGPGHAAVEEVFTRAAAVLETVVVDVPSLTVTDPDSGGSIRFHRPHEMEGALSSADILLVDEAAAIPVDRLQTTLDAGIPVAYSTTVHGYEGTGRGFAVRFLDRLERSDRPIERIYLEEPIRYRAGDPIESWQFRALLLDASPPVGAVIDGATTSSVDYEVIDRDALVADEATLRELFGLLVLAHYRTEPDDLLRLLDAPNISLRALMYRGHPVSVAMLAAEGGLDHDWRDRLFAGETIRGHMIPDLLTTQLRDRTAGTSVGIRFLRVATHDAVRSRGLGSRLLSEVTDELAASVDWIGAGFGVTPRLFRFWVDNGYRPVHLGTSRNPRSGEHSAVVMRSSSPAGEALVTRHERRLIERLPGQLPDTLRAVDPSLIDAFLRAAPTPADRDIPGWMWAAVDAAARGPGQVATAPEAFAALTVAGLNAGTGDELSSVQTHLVVRRTLQAWPLWEIAEELELTLGDARAELRSAISTLWDRYDGPD